MILIITIITAHQWSTLITAHSGVFVPMNFWVFYQLDWKGVNPSDVKQGAELKKERVGKDEWVGRPSKKLSSIQSGSCCLLGRAAEEEVKEQQHCAPCNV